MEILDLHGSTPTTSVVLRRAVRIHLTLVEHQKNTPLEAMQSPPNLGFATPMFLNRPETVSGFFGLPEHREIRTDNGPLDFLGVNPGPCRRSVNLKVSRNSQKSSKKHHD